MKKVTCSAEVPNDRHYTVLVYSTRDIHHEGDERSKTHPGHGYPAYTESINEVEHFVTHDKENFESKIKLLMSQQADFVFFEVQGRGKIDVKIDVNIST